MVQRCHERGMKVMAMVDDRGRRAHRSREPASTCIVAQGSEAGGHRSIWSEAGRPHESAAIGTLALVPQIVDAVRASR